MTAGRLSGSLAALCLALTLGACGGDSSSGGGGVLPDLVGTYNVTGTGTVATAGSSASESFESVVVIEGDGDVLVDPNSSNSFTGTLAGDALTAQIPGERLDSPTLGVSCTGTIEVAATVLSTGISDGSISDAGLACNGAAVAVTGSFSGMQVDVPGAGGRGDQPLLGALRSAVHGIL